MSGTSAGGKKAAEKIRSKDPDFYRRIGKVGGSRTSGAKGFALMDPRAHQAASSKGGKTKKSIRVGN